MKLKHLESALSSITREFPSPNVELEQYPTSAHLAALVGLTALENNDIGEGRTALDLGCGTGMLAISCALLDTDYVIALDCDAEAMTVARNNVENLELEDKIDFLLGKVKAPPFNNNNIHQGTSDDKHVNNGRGNRGKKGGRGGKQGRGSRGGRGRSRNNNNGGSDSYSSAPPPMPPITISNNGAGDDDGISLRAKCVDTVITNPPFGTKQNAGYDIQFLRTAIRLARRAVYSFHKTSTRDYLIRTLRNDWGLDVKVVAQMKFDIPNMYKFHQKKSVDVEVDLIRVCLETDTKNDKSNSLEIQQPEHQNEDNDDEEEEEYR